MGLFDIDTPDHQTAPLDEATRGLAEQQAALGNRSQQQYQGFLNQGISDQMPGDDNSFIRSEAALGTYIDPGQLGALRSRSQAIYGDAVGALKFNNMMKAQSLQFEGLNVSFQTKLKLEKMIQGATARRLQNETVKTATRNSVIGSVLGIAGGVAGFALGGPPGALLGNQLGQQMGGPGLNQMRPQRQAYAGNEPSYLGGRQMSDELGNGSDQFGGY